MILYLLIRTFFKKCEDNTPPDFLAILREKQDRAGGEAVPVKLGALGDGQLSKEYTRLIEMRQKLSEELDSHRISEDVKFAAELVARERAEEELRRREREETAQRDAQFALRFAASTASEDTTSAKRPFSAEVSSEESVSHRRKTQTRPCRGLTEWLAGPSTTGCAGRMGDKQGWRLARAVTSDTPNSALLSGPVTATPPVPLQLELSNKIERTGGQTSRALKQAGSSNISCESRAICG